RITESFVIVAASGAREGLFLLLLLLQQFEQVIADRRAVADCAKGFRPMLPGDGDVFAAADDLGLAAEPLQFLLNLPRAAIEQVQALATDRDFAPGRGMLGNPLQPRAGVLGNQLAVEVQNPAVGRIPE